MFQPKIHPALRYSRYILCIGFMIAFMAYLVPQYALYVLIAGTAIFVVGFVLQVYLYRISSRYRVKTSLGIDFLFPDIDHWIVAVDYIAMPDEPIPTEAELTEAEIAELIQTIQLRKRKSRDAANQLAIGGSKVVPYVSQLFSEEHSDPRFKAAAILRHIGSRAAEAVPTLIDAINDADPGVRAQVICALARIGPKSYDALPALVNQLSHESDDIRICAALTIGRIHRGRKAEASVINSISALLEDPMPSVQTAGLISLISLGQKDEDTVSLLINGLRDRNAVLALLCTENLGFIGKKATEAFPDLIEALDVQHPIIQIKVSHALYRIGYDPLALLRSLLTAGKAGEIYVKYEALQVLEDMGDKAEPASTAYLRMLGDRNTLVRLFAVRAISYLGEKARPLASELRGLLKDPAKAVSFHAEQTLNALGEPLEEPVQEEETESDE
ncbi:MAG: HEAT repeat domain-containing protein [Promethearchaeota archaeon]